MQQSTWGSHSDGFETNGIARLRERLVSVEKDAEHLHERAIDTTLRIQEGEQRLGRVSYRVNGLEQVNFARLKLESKLEEVPERLMRLENNQRNLRQQLENDRKQRREYVKWAGVVLLAFLSIMGILPEGTSKKIFSLLPPGIAG